MTVVLVVETNCANREFTLYKNSIYVRITAADEFCEKALMDRTPHGL